MGWMRWLLMAFLAIALFYGCGCAYAYEVGDIYYDPYTDKPVGIITDISGKQLMIDTTEPPKIDWEQLYYKLKLEQEFGSKMQAR